MRLCETSGHFVDKCVNVLRFYFEQQMSQNHVKQHDTKTTSIYSCVIKAFTYILLSVLLLKAILYIHVFAIANKNIDFTWAIGWVVS